MIRPKPKARLEIGRVYIGDIHKDSVWYLGYWSYEDSKIPLHQFEYIKCRPAVAGYGQTDEQSVLENYKISETEDILYARDVD